MKIVIGNDHAGTLYKKAIVDYLLSKNYQVINVGTDDTKSVDYPDFAHPVGEIMDKGEADYGIVICGSGNGVAMTVNKHIKVRCALCWTKEIASLARQHNDANVIAIPARFTAQEQAIEIVKTFLMTDFEGGRHLRRIEKI
ncbi:MULTISPECIES: ribose 5-phosphate isomerase B [unclassified Capnocytophaga]|jgi:ribose 5-phosphate isomerase B|uniref:ribose 5-phosphate isomerase B n=1 Tax=unclassified Capnocytophaga TaxID=2640652 RepID=UPI000202ED20|nr:MULTISPECIES: ribose 5-phosphate isomerase B [unclassified Capnocytophaga]EGD34219.1 ribose 5-phosphate isomerase B [Capnocytophaga sp. oral taxon 338 str. F0234]MEB3004894.1 ribose 5-phosphate isomerase B [Capnocytophaga sp. G2]